MIYSGADLIRNSSQLAERFERSATVESVRPIGDSPAGLLDEDTQDALARFARFLNQDKAPPRKKASSRSKTINPYALAEERENEREGLGHTVDIYA